jgi:hypothetical protein
VVVSNDEGGALEANKALLDGHYKTLQGTGTSGEPDIRARATAFDGCDGSKVSGGATREPLRTSARKGGGPTDA